MATLEQLIKKEGVLFQRLEYIIENGKKTAIVKRTKGFHETKIAELKKTWDDYSDIDITIRKTISETE